MRPNSPLVLFLLSFLQQKYKHKIAKIQAQNCRSASTKWQKYKQKQWYCGINTIVTQPAITMVLVAHHNSFVASLWHQWQCRQNHSLQLCQPFPLQSVCLGILIEKFEILVGASYQDFLC